MAASLTAAAPSAQGPKLKFAVQRNLGRTATSAMSDLKTARWRDHTASSVPELGYGIAAQIHLS
jgi:hypothetical protein